MSIISSIFAIVLVIDAAIGLQMSVRQSDRPPKDVTTVCWAIMLLSGLGKQSLLLQHLDLHVELFVVDLHLGEGLFMFKEMTIRISLEIMATDLMVLPL